MASATSRIDLRVSMLSFWRRRNEVFRDEEDRQDARHQEQAAAGREANAVPKMVGAEATQCRPDRVAGKRRHLD